MFVFLGKGTEEGELIEVHDGLDHAAVANLADGTAVDADAATGGRIAVELAVVGASGAPAGDYVVACGDHLKDIEMEIGEGGEIGGGGALGAFGAANGSGKGVALEKVGIVIQRGETIEVVGVESIVKLLNKTTVFGFGHGLTPNRDKNDTPGPG